MDSDLEEQEGRNPLRDRNKLLETENAELRAQVEAASSAARELAFVKAGIDPELPIAKYFVKAYDGDLTADAIREAGIEAGLLKDMQAESIEQEAGTWNRANQIAAGSDTEPLVDFVTRISQARSQAEVEKLLAEAQAQSEVL